MKMGIIGSTQIDEGRAFEIVKDKIDAVMEQVCGGDCVFVVGGHKRGFELAAKKYLKYKGYYFIEEKVKYRGVGKTAKLWMWKKVIDEVDAILVFMVRGDKVLSEAEEYARECGKVVMKIKV